MFIEVFYHLRFFCSVFHLSRLLVVVTGVIGGWQLLDVADNLERAVESAKEGGAAGASLDTLLEGVEMTSDQVKILLRREKMNYYGSVPFEKNI